MIYSIIIANATIKFCSISTFPRYTTLFANSLVTIISTAVAKISSVVTKNSSAAIHRARIVVISTFYPAHPAYPAPGQILHWCGMSGIGGMIFR